MHLPNPNTKIFNLVSEYLGGDWSMVEAFFSKKASALTLAEARASMRGMIADSRIVSANFLVVSAVGDVLLVTIDCNGASNIIWNFGRI